MTISKQQAFFNQVYAHAREAGCNHIQSALCAAQSAIETGWGDHVKGNSYFGVKASRSWKGKVESFTTHEVIKGKRVKLTQKFRAYDTKVDSIRDYAKVMTHKFNKAWNATTMAAAAEGLKHGRYGAYATDPDYSKKVLGTMRSRAKAAQQTLAKAINMAGWAKQPKAPTVIETKSKVIENAGKPGMKKLVRGDEGIEVEDLQTRLRAKGFYAGDIDGKFGGGTEAAVMHFQRDAGLQIDGVFGPKTHAKLKTWTKPASKIERASVTYTNQHAIRNKKVLPALVDRLAHAIMVVYGPGARGEIYSGGQDRKGRGSRRTGSIRHDDYGLGGRAMDVHVFDVSGKQIVGVDLAKLGQYWLAAKYGSVGLEMAGGGIHLDDWAPPPPGGGLKWQYAYSRRKPYAAEIDAKLEAGVNGIFPDLYRVPVITTPGKTVTVETGKNERILVGGGIGVALTGIAWWWGSLMEDLTRFANWIGF